jgi:Protein of unknown function (DUF2528)
MIRHYTFNYNIYDAEAKFKVDTEKFTAEIANQTLHFFTWDYNEDEYPIDEVLKKYAMEAIKIATFNNYNVTGVISAFNSNEGYCKVDGSMGIELISVEGYEFDDDELSMEVATVTK